MTFYCFLAYGGIRTCITGNVTMLDESAFVFTTIVSSSTADIHRLNFVHQVPSTLESRVMVTDISYASIQMNSA